MEFKICDPDAPVTICGQNNVGKTNTLRAINLFFHPDKFNQQKDIPVLKVATHGGSYYPIIVLTFASTSDSNTFIELSRDFKVYDERNTGLTGKKITLDGRKNFSNDLKESQIKSFINNLEFRFIRSIDVNVPELINDLTSDILDTRYQKSRFTKKKKELKDAYDKYSKGMQQILDSFSADVSAIFHSFKENWDIKFTVPTKVDRFRDMISDDVELTIDDKSGMGVSNKGSGLQRLAIILLNLEILKRIDRSKKETFIVCIDEPDIYLHEGLQKNCIILLKSVIFKFFIQHILKLLSTKNQWKILFFSKQKKIQDIIKGSIEM